MLGMGNEILSDDAVGLLVLEKLRERFSLEEYGDRLHFKGLNTGGLDLLYELEGYDYVLVVDAYYAPEGRPGRVRLVCRSELEPAPLGMDSAHLLSLPAALQMSRELGYRTPQLIGAVVIDVGDRCRVFGDEISGPVAQAVPAAVELAGDLICNQLGVRRSPALTGTPQRCGVGNA